MRILVELRFFQIINIEPVLFLYMYDTKDIRNTCTDDFSIKENYRKSNTKKSYHLL